MGFSILVRHFYIESGPRLFNWNNHSVAEYLRDLSLCSGCWYSSSLLGSWLSRNHHTATLQTVGVDEICKHILFLVISLGDICLWITPAISWTKFGYISYQSNIWFRGLINVSPTNAAYKRQWIGPTLVQIIPFPCSVPSHYLNQCWYIVNWILTNKFCEIRIEKQNDSFTKMRMKISSAKMAAIFFRVNELRYKIL